MHLPKRSVLRLRQLTLIFAVSLLLSPRARGQDPLSLRDAVHLALEKNPAIAAANAGKQAAAGQMTAAHSGMLPKATYSESWTRSDNPVFVFSSLLTEHQFGEQNFQIGPLNRPGFLNNFQSTVSLDQPLYDGGQTRNSLREAELSRDMANEAHRSSTIQIIAAAAKAYYDAALGEQLLAAANQAVKSADADLQRAEAIRAAGMSTDADVLSIRVHRAGVEEQRIRRAADLDVARAALNDALGLPLDTPHTLTTSLSRGAYQAASVADNEASAATQRPEAREAQAAVSLAQTHAVQARIPLRPQVNLHGAFEADRQRFYDRGGANWTVSLGLRWNLFDGFEERGRIEAATALIRQSESLRERTGSGIRLEVRQALAGLGAAEQRIAVAEATVAEAQESLRITQNRYEAGLSNVTELLRTETALFEARTRYLAAVHDQRVAAVAVELAAGRLNADSEVLN